MSGKAKMIDALLGGLQQRTRLTPSQWADRRVALYEGLSPTYDRDAAPWMIEPLDAIGDVDKKEIIVLAPIGTGKTTMMEAAMAYIISEDPGPTLLVGQTDADIKDWVETRLNHTLRNTRETSLLLPTGANRHKHRKDALILPSMSLFMTGANISGLQAKSMRRVFCDEPWIYEKGMIRESEGRLHDRWNRQWFGISQGGFLRDDWHGKWSQTNQHEFCFECPSCGHIQPWQWSQVVYDEIEGDKIATCQTARLVCENAECGHEIPDKPIPRREIAVKGRYVKISDGLPNSYGYHYTSIANWRLPLWRLVMERMNAMEEVKRGNLTLLRQFVQKRLADFWDDEQEDERPELVGGGYSITEYANGEKWDDEFTRFMTIDRQQDHFWAGIRAWSADGRSRLLWFGKVDTWDRLRYIQETYKVDNVKTQVDCGFQKDEVYKRCAQYGWLALRGDRRDSYPHKNKSGRTVFKGFSRYQKVSASNGRSTMVCYFSNLAIKDILHQLRNGKGVSWDVADDIGKDYLDQIDAEVRRGDGRTAVWKARRRDNHAVDVESMQIVLAASMGLIGTPESENE